MEGLGRLSVVCGRLQGMWSISFLLHPEARGFDLDPKKYFAVVGCDGIEALFGKAPRREDIIYQNHSTGQLLARGYRPASIDDTRTVEVIYSRGNQNGVSGIARMRSDTTVVMSS